MNLMHYVIFKILLSNDTFIQRHFKNTWKIKYKLSFLYLQRNKDVFKHNKLKTQKPQKTR